MIRLIQGRTRAARTVAVYSTYVVIDRAFFGSIPEDFGNRGESTTTKLPMRNKQWQKHHKKDQTTANLMTVFFFYEIGTAVWAREFYQGNFLLKQSG